VVTFEYTLTDATGADIIQKTSAVVDSSGMAARLVIDTVDDALYEASETFTVKVDSITLDGNPVFENLNLDSATVDTVIMDDRGQDTADTVIVTLDGDAQVNEGTSATYTVMLDKTAPPGSKVLLTYTYDTADEQDITEIHEAIILSDGKTANFSVEAKNDSMYEGPQAFTISVHGIVQQDGTTPAFEHIDDTAAHLTTTIMDETDRPEVTTLTADNGGQVTEGDTASWTLSLNNPSTTPTTITLTVADGATATGGEDVATVFRIIGDGNVILDTTSGNPPTFTLPAGLDTVRIELDTLDDVYIETQETLTLQARTDNQQNWTVADHVTTLHDDRGTDAADTVAVTLTPDKDDVTEGEAVTYTVELTHVAPPGSVVTFEYTLTDASGTDIVQKASAVVDSSGMTAELVI
ncbi:calcium-binding protein, partial [Veronia pacifica]